LICALRSIRIARGAVASQRCFGRAAQYRRRAMSIYEEKNGADVGTGGLRQSSRVGFGGGGGGGGGDDEAGQDGEVVIPDWGEDTAPTPPESDAAAGPAQCIAEFKAKREKREGVALGAVLIFLLVVAVSTVVGILMMMYNKNPATNPFFEEVDGSAALTPTGVSIYLALWFCKILVSSAIVSMPLDLEAMASEVRWADIAAGRVPQLVSVGAWAFFIVMEIVGGVGIYLVYGWCSCLLLPLIYLKLAVWKFEFAQEPVQPGEKHLLLRQPTCWEFQTLVMGAYACTIYPGFGLWCIHDGQWDGKTVGRFGGLALVLLQWALVVFWWMKRARVRRRRRASTAATVCFSDAVGRLLPCPQHVFHAGAPEGMNRQTLCAETLLWAYTLLPMTQVLFHPFLWPDMPDNADMITMQGRLVPGSGQGPWDKPWDTSYYLYNAVEACVPSLLFLVFRRQIYNALKAPFLTKQRLQDGAFIATLLAEDDADDMIGQATELFRGIAFSKVSAELLRSSKGSAEEYKLSRPCKLNSVDFFVSHSTSSITLRHQFSCYNL
jgi:hypothetical protein